MATVIFSSELQKFTGEDSTNVSAGSYRELVDEIVARYPDLSREEITSKAVSIDGMIIQDPLLDLVESESEVHFLDRISGG
jgi:molybdopterin converting factor small subunit